MQKSWPNNLNLRILIASPHLDDAALSCAEHINSWQVAGCRVHVVSLMTDFGSLPPSDYMRPFMKAQGCEDVLQYGELRRHEDEVAMKKMGIEFTHAGFRDAAFREKDGRFSFSNYRELTTGLISNDDIRTVDAIQGRLGQLPLPDLVMAPLGIGNHIDHLIVQEAVRNTWSHKAPIGFYFDLPYARNPLKYSLSVFRFFSNCKISLRFVSPWKIDVLGSYASQMPYLFRGRPRFPEILLLPRKAVGVASEEALHAFPVASAR